MASEASDINPYPYAPHPFDHPRADLILRSDDSIDFRVSTFILAITSEFFANMLSDGQPDEKERRDGCPIILVQEHSRTLQNLLSFIYPVEQPILDDVSHVEACLAAALKYGMTVVVNRMKLALRSITPKAPLRTWAVAVRHGLEVEARAAAEEVVHQSLSMLELDELPPEMHEISAGAYFRLLRFQRLAGNIANFPEKL